MTYEHAYQWAIDNFDPQDYDTYEEYLEAIDSEFRNPFSEFMPDSYLEQLHEYYDQSHIYDNEAEEEH
jgi:outer membrane protein assembly factor BamD (BamD/ComL family)